MNKTFVQSHAPRRFNTRYSPSLPAGQSFVMDRDGTTFLTDDQGHRLVKYVG